MSYGEDDDVLFECYYGRSFVVVDGIKVSYGGGGVLSILSQPQSVMTCLMETLAENLCGKRLWFKFPFDDFSELRELCNEDDNFCKMCLAAKWVKQVEIFIEDDREGENVAGDHSEGYAEYVAADEEGGGDHFVDMEDLVEDTLAGFVDEEEHNHDEETPLNSDCEGGERRHIRYTKGCGVIRLKQVFDNISEFKEAVIDYSLKEGVNVKFTRWGSETCEVKCGVGGDCKFMLYCSYKEPIGTYMVKHYDLEHACTADGYSKVLKSRIICNMFLNDIRKDPTYKPKRIQEVIEERYQLTATNYQCRKAKSKALKMIQAEYDEQFARIHDYKLQLEASNPESNVEVVTVTGEGGLVQFDRIYICFAALKKTWLAHCRPIFGIDGCFLKHDVKGQLLAAVRRDAKCGHCGKCGHSGHNARTCVNYGPPVFRRPKKNVARPSQGASQGASQQSSQGVSEQTSQGPNQQASQGASQQSHLG